MNEFAALSPTTLADVLGRAQVMRFEIHPLWSDMPRLVGPAYPVRCAPGDNLMLHAAIHRAPPGSVVVCEAGDCDYAMAGGNVCATAQARGIAGFVVDGVVRDLAEIRAARFPVFARGLMPIPGTKEKLGVLDGAITCGGVRVEPRDVIVADEEGIVVIPHARAAEILQQANARAAKDAAQTLAEWQRDHRSRVNAALAKLGVGL